MIQKKMSMLTMINIFLNCAIKLSNIQATKFYLVVNYKFNILNTKAYYKIIGWYKQKKLYRSQTNEKKIFAINGIAIFRNAMAYTQCL
jgi:hypothetical protein